MDLTIHASFLPHADPDASLAFYRDTLGFEVRPSYRGCAARPAISQGNSGFPFAFRPDHPTGSM